MTDEYKQEYFHPFHHIDLMIRQGTYWCPTLYIYGRGGRNANSEMSQFRAANFKRAVEKGVKIVYGTDVGGFSWDQPIVQDFPYMVKFGMSPLEALRSTRIAGLPDDINHQRTLLEARALAALKQWDQALDMIAVDEQPDTRQLRDPGSRL